MFFLELMLLYTNGFGVSQANTGFPFGSIDHTLSY